MTAPDAFPDVETLLPHRGPMLLIDRIAHVDHSSATSIATVKETWPLHDGGGVPSIVVIELVAQTCGLCNGLRRIADQGADSEKKGFMVGVKDARLFADRIPEGATITTTARNRFVFESFREVEGEARIGDRVLGTAILQVVQAETEEESP